jgi:hypothetical protein
MNTYLFFPYLETRALAFNLAKISDCQIYIINIMT